MYAGLMPFSHEVTTQNSHGNMVIAREMPRSLIHSNFPFLLFIVPFLFLRDSKSHAKPCVRIYSSLKK